MSFDDAVNLVVASLERFLNTKVDKRMLVPKTYVMALVQNRDYLVIKQVSDHQLKRTIRILNSVTTTTRMTTTSTTTVTTTTVTTTVTTTTAATTTPMKTSFSCYECGSSNSQGCNNSVMMNCPMCMISRNDQDPS